MRSRLRMARRSLLLLATLSFSAHASATTTPASSAALTLPSFFSDGAVLQVYDEGDARSFVYGTAAPASSVALTLTSSMPAMPFSRTYRTMALMDGGWAFQIDGTYAPDAQGRHAPHYGPFSVTVAAGGERRTFSDVRFGDVYLCVGGEQMLRPVVGAGAAAAAARAPADIRRFEVAAASSAAPSSDVRGAWRIGTASLANFSALCYGTALALARMDPAGNGVGNTTGSGKLCAAHRCTMPIGVIHAAAESTLAAWAPAAVAAKACGGGGSGRFNGMLAPLLRLALRGVVYAGGEADLAAKMAPATYADCFAQTVSAWRDSGQIGDFAVVFTQLGASTSGAASALRLAQATALPRPFAEANSIDTTAMAARYDTSNTSEVARRVALGMVHAAYSKQEPGWGWSSPVLEHVRVSANEVAHGVFLSFAATEVKGGLRLVDRPGCTICCKLGGGALVQASSGGLSGPWHNATSLARMRGKDWVLGARFAAAARLVRVAAGPDADCFLYNANGMPVLPAIANVTAAEQIRLPEPPGILASRESYDAAAITPPPMGFNTWNRWHCWVDERLLKQTADLMVSLGLAAAGYRSLNIDDCWQSQRALDATGRHNGTIDADPTRFPSGLRAFSEYVHAKNMSFGVYTSQSEVTCQARPGSWEHEALDAKTYCDADVDYIKIDHCGGGQWSRNNISWMLFRAALDKCAAKRKRKFWMSCSSCGPTKCLLDGSCVGKPSGCGQWIAKGRVSCDLWRTGGDIQARWSSIMANLDMMQLMAPVQNAGPGGAGIGHFNDPDMLQVGNIGLTILEQRSHMALWCLLGGPLLISTDLKQISAPAVAILKTKGLIDLNQDTLATQGERIGGNQTFGCEVWCKKLSGGRLGLVLLNRSEETSDITVTFADLIIAKAGWTLTDLWTEKSLGKQAKSYTAQAVPSHGNVALLLV